VTTWDPAQYQRFWDQRSRPARDLIAHLDHPGPGLVVDLGCGPGNVTAALAERWPAAQAIGVDTSPTMLAEARRDHPDLTWVEGDLVTYEPPRPADVVFSNAALHWVLDHEAVFPALLDRVAPGGLLAVQMPADWDAPAHAAAFEVAAQTHWRERLAGVTLPAHPVLDPERYLDLLAGAEVDLWTTTYFHLLDGPDPVVEWFRGSLLRAFVSPLDEADAQAFVAEYAERVAAAYPPRADGRTVLPFRRLFMVAARGRPAPR
jgi:trans-aconitate 2-methyltransferase